MNPIDLKLSELGLNQVVVKGQLYHTYDPADLDQDILEIDLPNGISIDVGWHPESDPGGSFRIVVFRNFWPNQLRDPIRTQNVSEVVEAVRRLAVEYSGSTVMISCSSESLDQFTFSAPGPFQSTSVAI